MRVWKKCAPHSQNSSCEYPSSNSELTVAYLSQTIIQIQMNHESCFFQTQLGRFLFWPAKAECSHGGCSTCWGIGMSCSLQISMKQIRRKMKPLRSQRNHHPHWPKRNTQGPCHAKHPRFILDFRHDQAQHQKNRPWSSHWKLLPSCSDVALQTQDFLSLKASRFSLTIHFRPGELHACVFKHTSCQVEGHFAGGFLELGFIQARLGAVFFLRLPVCKYQSNSIANIQFMTFWWYDMIWYSGISFLIRSNIFFVTKTFQGPGERSCRTQASKSIAKNDQVANLKDTTSESKRHSGA